MGLVDKFREDYWKARKSSVSKGILDAYEDALTFIVLKELTKEYNLKRRDDVTISCIKDAIKVIMESMHKYNESTAHYNYLQAKIDVLTTYIQN